MYERSFPSPLNPLFILIGLNGNIRSYNTSGSDSEDAKGIKFSGEDPAKAVAITLSSWFM